MFMTEMLRHLFFYLNCLRAQFHFVWQVISEITSRASAFAKQMKTSKRALSLCGNDRLVGGMNVPE